MLAIKGVKERSAESALSSYTAKGIDTLVARSSHHHFTCSANFLCVCVCVEEDDEEGIAN